VDKNMAWSTDIQKLQTAEGYPLLLKPPYGIIASEAAENKKCRLLFGNRQIIIKVI